MQRALWQKVLIAAAGVLIFSFAANYLYFNARYKELSDLKFTLANIEREISYFKTKIKGADGKTPSSQDIEKQIEEISKKIPNEKDMPYMMEEFIKSSSKGLALDYKLVQPQPAVTEEGYMRLPIRIEMDTDFENLYLFFSRVDNMPLIVQTDVMDLRKNETRKNLNVSLQLSTFMTPGGSSKMAQSLMNDAQIPYSDPFFDWDYKKISRTKLIPRSAFNTFGKKRGQEIWKSIISSGYIDKSGIVQKKFDGIYDKFRFSSTSETERKKVFDLLMNPPKIEYKAAKAASRPANLPQFKGVFAYDGKVKVFVNNSVLSIGQSINGYRITAVKGKKLIVNKSGRSYTLTLGR